MKQKSIERVQRVVAGHRVAALNPQHGVVRQTQLFSDDPWPTVSQFGTHRRELICGVHDAESRQTRLVVKTHKSAPIDHNDWMGQLRETVAANLQRLMEDHVELRTQSALARRSKVPQRTIGRIVNKEVTASLDVLEALAKPFDLQPWQLLVPGIDPKNPPVLRFASAAEEALYKRIVAAATELARKQPLAYPPPRKNLRCSTGQVGLVLRVALPRHVCLDA